MTRAFSPLAALVCCVGASAAQDFEPVRAFDLPPELREVSGLASAGPSRVLAHDDERSVVFMIDVASGEVLGKTRLGRKTARGDFEGIAQSGGSLYLTTSDGTLFEVPGEVGGGRVRYNTYDTGLGEICEIEGLEGDGDDGLLLLCKDAGERLKIYRWSVEGRHGPPRLWADIPLSGEIADARWTGLARDADQLLVLSSKGHVIVELSAEGGLLSVTKLDPRRHPQAEGLTLLAGGLLVIADEGGKAPGRLTVYERAD